MSNEHETEHAEANVERLIGTSYRPEEPAPDFAARVRDRLLAEAAAQRPTGHPTRSARRAFGGQRVAALAAAAAMVAAVIVAGTDGELPARRAAVRAPDGVLSANAADRSGGATARPRGDAPEAQHMVVGDRIETGPQERRRVLLPDGSVLFVNTGTALRVTDDRRIDVTAGEVYVEVRPDETERFHVVTPVRRFTALGTRFGVRVGDATADLLVTHGRVGVSGMRDAVESGQRFVSAGGDERVETAPRASHLLDWTRDLVAAAESPLVPASEYGGGALIAFDPWGQEARLSLRKYHVDVHIEDGFARTTIDQTYFNHATWRLEGTFYFPLPADASLSRLAMYVGAMRMEGGMTERNRARDVFEQIVTRRKDPALLEWVDGSTFKMRVFPLEPREEKRIVLSYTQRLETLYGETRYRFPVGHDLDVVGNWSFAANVAGGAGAAWDCDTHALESETTGRDLHLTAEKKGALLRDDVVLKLRRTRHNRGATRFDTAVHEGHRYLMVRHSPHLDTDLRRERRDWVFLFEASGSRDPLLARVQADVVGTLLDHAEAGDTFTVLTAGTRVRALSDGLLPVTAGNLAAARAFLDGTHLIGALDLERALGAVALAVADADNPYVVHVGGGVATLGERDPGALARLVPDAARYVGVAVGRRWSRTFMRSAASRTGGYVTEIQPDEPVTWRAFDLSATLATPRLQDVSVVDDAESAPFLVFGDSVADGEEIAAIVRLPENARLPERVTLAGVHEGRTWTTTIDVADVGRDAGYLPRQWARLEIERLVAEDAEKHHDAIVALSKSSYVMSPFTSLLVLETEAMYEQFGVDRGRSDHWAMYPAPDEIEVVREPLEGRDSENDGRVTQADIERVMRSVLIRHPTRLVHLNDQWHGYGYVTNSYDGLMISGAGGGGGGGSVRLDTTAGFDIVDVGGSSSGSDPTGGPAIFNRLEGFRETRAQSPWGGRWNWWQPQAQAGAGFALRDGGYEKKAGYLPHIDRLTSDADLLLVDTGVDVRALMSLGGRLVLASSGPRPTRGGRSIGGRESFGKESETGRRSSLASARVDFELPMRPLGGAYRGPGGEVPPSSRDPSDPPPPPTDGPWDGYLRDRLQSYQYGNWQAGLFLQQASLLTDLSYFSDLLSRMPAFATSWADVGDVVLHELPDLAPRPGRIDDAAGQLIERARRARPMVVSRVDDGIRTEGVVGGYGRFRLERRYPDGLREVVVHDGRRLLHVYPSVGLAARRVAGAVAREELAYVAPWHVPAAVALARGADVILVDALTIHVVPHAGGGREVLVFEPDGVLAERRWEKDDGEVLGSERFARVEGAVRVIRKVGDDQSVEELPASRGDDVDVSVPDGLVTLDLPFRTWDHVVTAVNADVKRRMGDEGLSDPGKHYTADDRVALGVAQQMQHYGFGSLSDYLRQQVVDHHDPRIGLHALVLSSGWAWNAGALDESQAALDPTRAHPDHPLARYAREVSHRDTNRDADVTRIDDPWLARLADLRNVLAYYASGRAARDVATQDRVTREVMDRIDAETDDERAYALALCVRSWGRPQPIRERLAEAYDRLADHGVDSFRTRCEAAFLRAETGTEALRKRAREDLTKLQTDVLDRGYLPPVDHRMRNAFGGGGDAWREHWQGLARRMVAAKRHAVVPLLATQCAQLGDRAVADELLELGREGLPAAAELSYGIAQVEHHVAVGERQTALRELEVLVEREDARGIAPLWRFGAMIADQAGDPRRALAFHEQALAVEFDQLGDVIDLQAVRQEYQGLLQRFQQLAQAAGVLDAQVGDDVRSRIVAVVDRWRVLDDDPSGACDMAGDVFAALGDDALAWDYLTTPLDAKPNEAAPWTNLAQRLGQKGRFDLADQAYATAFDIEPTNADILWARAEVLRTGGRPDLARPLLEQLASGTWQPRFQGAQEQAKRRLGR